jgi:hypothetical protein
MPSRTVRQRQNRRLGRLAGRAAAELRAEAAWQLPRWRAEAHRRADDLGAPAVWALWKDNRRVALALDPGGELAEALRGICIDAVARAARIATGGSRPAADRIRTEARPVAGRSRP